MGSVSTWDEVPYGRRLLPTLIDKVAVEDPTRECFQIPRSANIADGWKVITWKDMSNAVNRAAHRMVELCGKPEPNSFPTIAYIGPNDIRYVVTMIASIKAGYQALFISPRNSKEGQLSLFAQTNCNIIAYAEPHKHSVQTWLQEREQMQAVEVSPLAEWFPAHQVPHFPYTKTFAEAEWDPFGVLHTSGSTGLPKPIVVRQGMVAISDGLKNLPRWKGERVATTAWAHDARRMLVAMPLFHMAGVIGCVMNGLYEGCPFVLPPSDRPMTSDLVIECLANVDADSVMVPPAIVEDLSQSEEGITAMKKLTSVAFGGGNLARECGNRLIKRGVRIMNMIGATEFAPFPMYERADPSLWQYFHYNADILGCEFRKVAGEDDVFEMVMVRKPENKKHPGLQGVFYTFPELSEWSTKDLYRPHPTLPDYWMYHGRSDNIIVFSNGEKLNPVTIEEIICDHAELKGALVVGSQRFQAGLIVEPQVHPQTAEEQRALLDRVWPLVEKANSETVQHGRISRDMLVLSDPDVPFSRAGKGTVQRALTVKLYKEHINKMYEHGGANNDDAPKLNVESEDALAQSIVETLQKHLAAASLEADVDFFAAGIDSLGIMNAAKILRAGLTASGHAVDAKTLGPKVIYTNSTPRRLAAHIFNTIVHRNAENGGGATQSEDEQQREAMRELHSKYTANLPVAAPNRPDPRNENQVVLLTGSTGMLGSYLLDMMAHNPRVAKIICLNRAADGGRAQQSKALADRGLDLAVLDTKAEFHHADMSKHQLGLSPDVYARLQAETDRVIHNAWPVNFNIPIESFAPSLAGVRAIADLAATAARRVAVTFISSIATADSWDPRRHGADKVPETRLEDLTLPLGGYGRSKAVGSLIIEDAAAKPAGDFPCAVVRVGQVAGPLAESGAWNRHEWLPSIVASSLYLGALPRELGSMDRVDWTPAEGIARLVLEAAGVARVVGGADEVSGYYHGVNPHATEWAVLADAVREFYGAERIRELVSFEEWCERLERSQADGEDSVARNPGLKLIDSYRGMAAGAGARPVVYDMARTAERCPVVGETTAVTAEMMKHWCKQWGF